MPLSLNRAPPVRRRSGLMMEKILAEFTGSIVKLFTASGGRAYVGLLAEMGDDYVLLKDQIGGADSYIAIHSIEAVIPLPRDHLDAPSQ
jgi:hypothetical protein